jgi:hypothetical protein
MLARVIAGEAGVPFFQSSGSEFNDKYLVVAVLKSMLAEEVNWTRSMLVMVRER